MRRIINILGEGKKELKHVEAILTLPLINIIEFIFKFFGFFGVNKKSK
ncbi:MAG: hypothetical protein QW762_01965 [Candidatus Thermoplasmatota archaeon]